MHLRTPDVGTKEELGSSSRSTCVDDVFRSHCVSSKKILSMKGGEQMAKRVKVKKKATKKKAVKKKVAKKKASKKARKKVKAKAAQPCCIGPLVRIF